MILRLLLVCITVSGYSARSVFRQLHFEQMRWSVNVALRRCRRCLGIRYTMIANGEVLMLVNSQLYYLKYTTIGIVNTLQDADKFISKFNATKCTIRHVYTVIVSHINTGDKFHYLTDVLLSSFQELFL